MYPPAQPGELMQEALEGLRKKRGYKVTYGRSCARIGNHPQDLTAIINSKQPVMPEMALKLFAGVKNTSAEFWLRIQES